VPVLSAAASRRVCAVRTAMTDSQPASKKPCLAGRIEVCSTCAGADAVLCDLEDIAPHAGVRVTSTGCLGRCGAGPNCFIEAAKLTCSPEESAAKAEPGAFRGEADERQDLIDELFRNSARPGWGGWGEEGDVVSQVISFDKCLDVVRSALHGADFQVPKAVLHRARLRSDAMRRMDSGFAEDLKEAEQLLSEAIDLEHQLDEAEPSPPSQHGFGERLQQLRMLRGDVRGSQALAQYDGALADFDAVLEGKPGYVRAHLDKAKTLRRARRLPEALESYQAALANLAEDSETAAAASRRWIDKRILELQDRLAEQAAVARGELGSADAGNADAVDSGDGSGRWRVVKITGTSLDSCIYHLRNHPPAEPHPCPRTAWHVCVRFGAHVREYTPVSTVSDWEQGSLDLLVKTYPDGLVSSRFAKLQKQNEYAPAEEQQCWVFVTAPRVTLHLPCLSEFLEEPHKASSSMRRKSSPFDGRWVSQGATSAIKGSIIHASDGRLFTLEDMGKGICLLKNGEEILMQGRLTEDGQLKWNHAGSVILWDCELSAQVDAPMATVKHVVLVVGGTGIAPALQLLREVADAAGAFGPECKATLLYSSRTSRDVLMLDELREVESRAPERILVRHTLTEELEDKKAAEAAMRAVVDRMAAIPGRHYHFASRYRPFKPTDGPLRTAVGEEAGLRGRITAKMLESLLPAPGPEVRTVICGPPGMLQDVQAMLCWLGHKDDAVVELKAFSDQQGALQEEEAVKLPEVTV